MGYTVVYSPTTPHICNICTTSGYVPHINSGICSQIKLQPDRRQNLPFLQHGVAIKKSPDIKGNMKFGSCSKLKFQTKHQIDKKPYTQKRKLLGDVSNQDTNKVFKKQKFKHASDLGLFL